MKGPCNAARPFGANGGKPVQTQSRRNTMKDLYEMFVAPFRGAGVEGAILAGVCTAMFALLVVLVVALFAQPIMGVLK